MKFTRVEKTEKPAAKSSEKLTINGDNKNAMGIAGDTPAMMSPMVRRAADEKEQAENDINGDPKLAYQTFQQGMISGEMSIRDAPFPTGSSTGWKHDADKYADNPYWQPITKDRELQMRSGVNPSEALKDILSNPGNYALDCGYFQQVVILAGMLNSMGDAEFDDYINGQSETFTLRNHLSTGINAPDEIYDNKNGTWYRLKAYKTLSSFDPEKFIKNAEIGTQLTIKTIPLAKTVFANENIVKVGDDSYIAQGLGLGPISLKEIKDELGQKAVEYGVIQQAELTNKWIKQNIYIRQIIVPSFTVVR